MLDRLSDRQDHSPTGGVKPAGYVKIARADAPKGERPPVLLCAALYDRRYIERYVYTTLSYYIHA